MRRNIRGRRDRAAKSRIKITRVAFVSFRVNWYCTKRWARDEASGRSAQNTEQGKNTFLSFRSSSKRSNVARYKGSFPRLCIFSFLSGRKNNTIDRGGGEGRRVSFVVDARKACDRVSGRGVPTFATSTSSPSTTTRKKLAKMKAPLE